MMAKGFKKDMRNPLRSRGFSLIELLAILAILGLMLAVGLPRLNKLRPGYQRKEWISKLNGLVAHAWHRALQTAELQRIFFDMTKRTIVVQQEDSEGKVVQKPTIFNSLPQGLQVDRLQIPSTIEFKQFFINGKNDMARPERILTTIWFYIVPEGLSQEVIINAVDNADTGLESPREFSLVLNPFTAQFKDYDTFQKP